MVKSAKKAQQRRTRTLPSSNSTINREKESVAKKAKQKVNTKGIRFPNNRPTQAYTQKIILEIIDKWRKSEPKQKNGEPPHGSRARIVREYQSIQKKDWLTDNQVKMKWQGMKQQQTKKAASAAATAAVPPPPPQAQALPGRPKGTTKKAKNVLAEKFVDMKNKIASIWSSSVKNSDNDKPNLNLKSLIMEQQSQFGLDPTIYPVSTSAVYSRVDRDRLDVKQTGQVSPALAIEPRIVMMIELSSKCNNEFTREEIIEFANSYVEGTEVEKDIIMWKLAHHKGWKDLVRTTGVMPTRAELGISWFNGFIKRNQKHIQYKPSSNVSFNRTEHCTYEKFSDMYDNVYRELLDGGYAEKMIEPKYFNKLGVMCEEAGDDSFGNIVDLAFTRPDLVFVADECGSNTNMSRDKMSAKGSKRCSVVGASVKVPACTSDCHFTTLAFTALTGKPVCAVMIIQKGSPLTYAEMNGFDIEATWIGNDDIFQKIQSGELTIADAVFDPEDLERNTGKGKVFPGGPVCTYKGVDIPTLVHRSDSGGITAEILVDCLRHIDRHIEKVEGDPPFACILDGHSSRLSIPFLFYINDLTERGDLDPNSNHIWNIYLGLPNGTAYWQVGDSSQQNGRYKNLTRSEKEYVRAQQRANLESISIKRHHAVIILHNAWDKCYGDLIGNKKAILDRGWNPLNRGVLHHNHIRRKDPPIGSSASVTGSTISGNSGDITDANVSIGAAGRMLNTLQTSTRRDIGREKQHQEEKKKTMDGRKENSLRVLAISRVTAGLVVKENIWNLRNKEFLAVMEEKNRKKLDKKAQSQSRRYDADLKKYLDGELLMKKTVLHYTAMKDEVYFLIDVNEKKAAIKRLKKEKKWLLSSDYLALIQYKQLAMEKFVKAPTKIDDRIAQWESLYRSKRDPTMPVKPKNYVVNVEDDDEAVTLDLLTSVPADLPPLPVIAPTADTDGDIANIAQSLLTLSTASATQATQACNTPNIQGNVQAL